MTETEANLTRCCGPSDCGHESDNGPGGPGRYCIGSACMAWRWRLLANPAWTPDNQMQFPPGNPYARAPAGIESKTDGRCGLAGSQ